MKDRGIRLTWVLAIIVTILMGTLGAATAKYNYKLVRVDANEIGFICTNGSSPVYHANGGIATLNCEN